VAGQVADAEWERTLRNQAIAICGARSVWEEMGEQNAELDTAE